MGSSPTSPTITPGQTPQNVCLGVFTFSDLVSFLCRSLLSSLVMASTGVTIMTTTSGKFRAQVRRDGQRKATKSFNTKEEAVRAGGVLLVQMGAEVTPERRAYVNLADLFELLRTEKNYAPTTADQLRMVIEKCPQALLLRNVADFTPMFLTQTYRKLVAEGWKVSRVEKLHDFIGPAFRLGVLHGWCQTNAAMGAVLPTRVKQKRGRGLTQADAEKVIASAALTNDQLPVALRLMANTGLRRGELVALRWCHVNDLPNTIWICESHSIVRGELVVSDTKTHESGWRRIDVSPDLMAHLLTLKKPGADYVFTRPDGVSPWRPDYLTQAFTRIRDRTGVATSIHGLRHLHASLWLTAGVEPTVVQERLGHASLTTTLNMYAHSIPGRQAEHAKALSF